MGAARGHHWEAEGWDQDGIPNIYICFRCGLVKSIGVLTTPLGSPLKKTEFSTPEGDVVCIQVGRKVPGCTWDKWMPDEMVKMGRILAHPGERRAAR